MRGPATPCIFKCRIDDSDNDGDWDTSDNEAEDDHDYDNHQRNMTRAPKKPRRKPTTWKSLREVDRSEPPTTRSRGDARRNSATSRSCTGLEVVGRRLRVSVMTEDTGKHEWHYGELIAHRMRKGKNQHLIRWDTVGEKDEWIFLEEEDYHMYQLGEREHQHEDAFEDGDKVSAAQVLPPPAGLGEVGHGMCPPAHVVHGGLRASCTMERGNTPRVESKRPFNCVE